MAESSTTAATTATDPGAPSSSASPSHGEERSGVGAVPRHESHPCKKCQAPMLWVVEIDHQGDVVLKHGKPKKFPVDYHPAEKGNVRIFQRAGKTIVALRLDRAEAADFRLDALEHGRDPLLRVPHHATCPFAEDFRKTKRKGDRR